MYTPHRPVLTVPRKAAHGCPHARARLLASARARAPTSGSAPPTAPPPRRRAPPRLCSSPPPVAEEDLVPLALPASQLPEFAAPQFSLEPIEPAARTTSHSTLLAVPAFGPDTR